MDDKAKKRALQMIENGVFIVTTKSLDQCYGSTVTWVSQTSMNPPLVMVAIKVKSGIYGGMLESGQFALHMLNSNQKNFASAFFTHSISGDTTINGKTYQISNLGNPILDDAAAVVECTINTIVEEGDHHIFVGEVVEAQVKNDSTNLALKDTGWHYGG